MGLSYLKHEAAPAHGMGEIVSHLKVTVTPILRTLFVIGQWPGKPRRFNARSPFKARNTMILVYNPLYSSATNFHISTMSYELANPPPGKDAPTLPPPSHFILSSPPGTDIWRKPPSTDVFNAPFLYRSLRLFSFRRARVTVSADWKTLYDQGGLCLALPQTQGSSHRKWIKTGIEFYKGAPQVSTVACDRWADWSLAPLPTSGERSLTIEMEREVAEGEKGSTLCVYMMEGIERRPIREITWVFGEDEEMEGECWVGAFVAKPTKDADDEEGALSVEFGNFSVETF